MRAAADGGLAQGAGQVPVALAGGVRCPCVFPADSLDDRGELGPGGQVAGGREAGHVHPDLGDDRRGGDPADAGDRVQARQPASAKGAIRSSILASTAAMSASRASMRASIVASRKAWWSLNRPTNASSQVRDLGAHPGPGQLGQHLRVPLAGDQRGHHVPAGDPEDVAGHHRQLDLGVLQQLLHPVLLRGRARRPDRSGSGSGPAAAGSARGGTKLGRSICRSATLHSHTASIVSVFGRPGRCLTSLAFTSQTSNPAASSR